MGSDWTLLLINTLLFLRNILVTVICLVERKRSNSLYGEVYCKETNIIMFSQRFWKGVSSFSVP